MTVLGVLVMFKPLEGILSLATVATALIGAYGVMRLMTGYRMRETPIVWPMLISAALSVFWAGYIVAQVCEVAPHLLGILSGMELLFNEAGLIAMLIFLPTAGPAFKCKLEQSFRK